MVTETMVGTLVSQEVAREDGTDVMWDALPGTTLAFLQALALAIHMVVTTDIGCVFPYSPQVNLEYDFFFFFLAERLHTTIGTFFMSMCMFFST